MIFFEEFFALITGLPLVALGSLAMQASIEKFKVFLFAYFYY